MKWENWMLCFCFKLSGNSCWADKLTLLSFSKKATASIFKHYFFLFQISFLQIVGNKKSKPKARRSSKVSRHSLNCSFSPLSQCLSIKEEGKSCLFRMEGFSVSWIPSTLSSLSLSTSSTLFSFPFFFSLCSVFSSRGDFPPASFIASSKCLDGLLDILQELQTNRQREENHKPLLKKWLEAVSLCHERKHQTKSRH